MNSVVVYDHCVDELSQMPRMRGGRYNHASMSIRNKLYMIGGSNTQCEVYDSLSETFDFIKSILPVYKHVWCKAQYVGIGNKIKIFNKISRDVAVYDIEENEWSEDGYLELGIEPHCLLFC